MVYLTHLGISSLYQLRVGLNSIEAYKKRHNFADIPIDIPIE